MDMARVQNIEAAVGESDPHAASFPSFNDGRRFFNSSFLFRKAKMSVPVENAQQLVPVYSVGSHLADNEAGRQVGHLG